MDSSDSDSILPGTPLVPLVVDKPRRPKILEGLCFRVTILSRVVAKQARCLPILGRRIGYVEDTLSRLLEPGITNAEKEGLHWLSLVDEQIHAVSEVAMAHSPLASKVIPQLQTLLSGQPVDSLVLLMDKVLTRGVVGSTADIWVEYEPIVRNKSQIVYNVAHRVPGLNAVIFILKDMSTPVVSLASHWLLTHSEMKDKHELMLSGGASTFPLDSAVTTDKDLKADERTKVGNNPMVGGADGDSHLSSNGAYSVASESIEHPEGVNGEIDEVLAKYEESALENDGKGKFPELTAVREDEEESDGLVDLFDIWGMGGKAISPHGLESLRTFSLGEATGSKGPRGKGQLSTSTKSSKF